MYFLRTWLILRIGLTKFQCISNLVLLILWLLVAFQKASANIYYDTKLMGILGFNLPTLVIIITHFCLWWVEDMKLRVSLF